MTLLDAQDLQKAYGPHTVLGGVSLAIENGERVGLVGINGSGKTTLARILAGLETADGGELAVRRGASIVYLPQSPVLEPSRTAREEVLAGLAQWSEAEARYRSASAALAGAGAELESLLRAQAQAAADLERLGGWEVAHRGEALLGHLGLTRLDQPVGTMSGGEQRRVGLARVLAASPDLAILDEPTNHLDVETVEWLERYLLEEHRGGLLLITHDRYLLDRVAQRILEIDRGTVQSYAGDYQDYLEAKAERMALEARAEANRQSLLRRELEWLRRQPRARTTKQKARVQRAEEAMAQAGPARAAEVRLSLDSARSGKTILELQGLRLEVDGRELLGGLDLTMIKGERLGVIGRSGCGKTTLLRTLIGELAPAGGEVVRGKNTRLSYLAQMRDGLDPRKSIMDNVADAGQVMLGERAVDARAYLDRFLFPPERLRQPLSSLSGGELTRVALAKLLCQRTNLVVLDEPANDLDLPTISALEQMLLDFEGTAIVVTHDRWFLDRVATSILSFEGEGRAILYAGSYSTYRALRAQREARERQERDEGPATGKARPATAAERPRPSRSGLTYGERLELEALMGKIEAAEARVAELEAVLADPETYRRPHTEVTQAADQLAQAREDAARLLARWEELESKQLGGG